MTTTQTWLAGLAMLATAAAVAATWLMWAALTSPSTLAVLAAGS